MLARLGRVIFWTCNMLVVAVVLISLGTAVTWIGRAGSDPDMAFGWPVVLLLLAAAIFCAGWAVRYILANEKSITSNVEAPAWGPATKLFVVGVARVAAITVVVMVALSGLGLGGFALWEHLETERNAPLEASKTWPPITVERLGGVTLTLSTKWREGKLLYHLHVAGYPPQIAAADPTGGPWKKYQAVGGPADAPKWSLVFLDKDGFRTAAIDAPIHEMITMANGVTGQHAGLDVNAGAYMPADDYRRAARLEISWAGFPEPKLPAPVIPPLPPGFVLDRPAASAGVQPPPQPTQARPGARPMIEVRMADGAIFQFPADTPDSVIDRMAKEYVQTKKQPPAPVAASAKAAGAQTPDVPKWKDIGLWRKLNRQMSKEQVRQLLGEPTRIEAGGVLVFWHYGYPTGGRVTFRENGSIYGFNEP